MPSRFGPLKPGHSASDAIAAESSGSFTSLSFFCDRSFSSAVSAHRHEKSWRASPVIQFVRRNIQNPDASTMVDDPGFARRPNLTGNCLLTTAHDSKR